MKKLYLLIFLFGCLLCWNVSFGQISECGVIIGSNTKVLDCKITSIELTLPGSYNNPNRYSEVWYNGSDTISSYITISVIDSGYYTVVVRDKDSDLMIACQQTIHITKNTTPPTVDVFGDDIVCSGTPFTLTATGADTFQWTEPYLLDGPIFTDTPNNTSNQVSLHQYKVIGTDTTNHCTTTFDDTIYVDTLPTTTIFASSSAVCSGDSVTLIASGALFYEWQDNFSNEATRSFIPLSSASYIVTGYDYYECHTTDTLDLIVNPLPVVSIQASVDSICNGISDTLTALGASRYQWLNISSTESSVAVSPAFTTPYKVVGFNEYNCPDTSTYTLVVKPSPVVRILAFPDTVVCSGQSATLVATGADTYQWQSDSLNDIIIVTPDTTTSYTVTGTDSATGCTNTTQPFTLAVRPLPEASISASRFTGCQYSTTDRPQITFTGSIGKPPYLFGYTDYEGNEVFIPTKAGSSTATISVPTGDSGSYIYRLTSVTDSNGCVHEINSQPVTVTIFPSPVLTSIKNPASICSDSVFTYEAKSSVPANTKFKWLRPAVPELSLPESSDTTAFIKDTLINNTPLTDTVTYIFTLSVANGNCPKSDTVKVIVNPVPSLIRANDTTACSGSNFSYTARSAPGTSFSWIRLPSTVVSTDAPAYGFDSTVQAVFFNNSLKPDTVSYVFTLTLGGGCIKIETVHFIVNPTDSIINKPSKDTTICSGTPFTFTAMSRLQEQETTFSWSRDSVAEISNGAKNIQDKTISETLINTTFKSVQVVYRFTLITATGCTKKDSITITVNPTDSLAGEKETIICSTVPVDYSLTSRITGTTFTWNRGTQPDILPVSDSSFGYVTSIRDTLTNLGIKPIDVTDTVTLITLNGCRSKNYVVVTVNPAPVVDNISDLTFCNGENVNGIGFNTSTSGASITWKSDGTYVGFSDTKGTDTILPFRAFNPGTQPLSTKVTVNAQKQDASGNNCSSADFPFNIIVNPTPKVTSISDSVFCSGTFVSDGIKFSSTSGNASVTWKSDKDIGFGDNLGNGNIHPFTAKNTDSTLRTAHVTIGIKDSITTCFNKDTILTVAVNPTPVLTNKRADTVCSGSLFHYEATSSVKNTVIGWSRAPVQGLKDTTGNSGTSYQITETLALADTASQSITVNYILTLQVGDSCAKDYIVPVTVNPLPKINPVSSSTFCNNELVSNGIPFSSPTPKASFEWQSSADVGFGIQDTGFIKPFTAIISGNMTTMDTIIATAIGSNGCRADTTFIIAVNPSPQLKEPADTAFCNGLENKGIPFTSTTSNSKFFWKSSINIGFSDTLQSGPTGIGPFTPQGSANAPVIASVSVRAVSNVGCSSGDSTFTITIYPSPAQIHFTSLSGTSPNGSPLLLCDSSENINFNVSSSQSDLNGIAYYWTSTLDSPRVNIKNPNYPNTVISFNDIGTSTITVTAKYQNTACVSTASQIVTVTDRTIDVSRQKIFKKNPGNLLIYPDNSLPGSVDSTSGYQWGYDKVLLPDTLAVSESHAVPGQIYQFYTPEPASCNCIEGDTLNTKDFYYWVLLKDGKGCSTKVYYNGPFDDKPDGVRLPNPFTSIQLRVIPNPNRGVFDVSVKGNMYGNIEAQVYSSAGQLVFSKKFVKSTPDATEKFITGALPAGTYFLVLRSSDLKQAHSRFIISR